MQVDVKIVTCHVSKKSCYIFLFHNPKISALSKRTKKFMKNHKKHIFNIFIQWGRKKLLNNKQKIHSCGWFAPCFVFNSQVLFVHKICLAHTQEKYLGHVNLYYKCLKKLNKCSSHVCTIKYENFVIKVKGMVRDEEWGKVTFFHAPAS